MRHAQTEANVKGICSGGGCDTALTGEGKKQAQEAGNILKQQGLEPDVLFCSPTNRTIDTAEIVCDVLAKPLSIIEPLSDLVERYYGAWEGSLFKDVQAELSQGHIGEGGEVLHDFHSRVFRCFLQLTTEQADKTILVVSHGGVWQALYDICKQDAPWLKNGQIYRLSMAVEQRQIFKQEEVI